MLTPSLLSDLKTKDHKLWQLITDLVTAINQSGLQLGVDPKPAPHVEAQTALPAPKPPRSISVVVVSLAVFVILEASPEATDSVFYFVERSESPTFDQVTRFNLGHGLQLAVPELPGTTYWRAFAKYQMSERSPYIAWEDE